MIVTFSKKYFNPLYFILNDILKNDKIRTVLVYGGKSSSKTISISQLLLKEAICHRSPSIAFRKESATIKTTLKKSFNLARTSMYLQDVVTPYEFRYETTEGCEIVLKGLDDEEKAKGIESYKYVFLDELNHFTVGEYMQFQMSLRGIKGQKMFGAWNPVDITSWIKTDLIDKQRWLNTEYKLPCENSSILISEDETTILIKTTYEDNYWISGSPCKSYGYRDEALINLYKKLEYDDPLRYKINVLGEWGQLTDDSNLCQNDAISDVFTNTHVLAVGAKSLSSDLAMQGRDNFIVASWTGLVCEISLVKNKATGKEIELDITRLKNEKSVPNSKIVVDSDGLGNYLSSYIQNIRTFHGNNTSISGNYDNIKSECAFKLAEMINRREIRIICTTDQQRIITQELGVLKQRMINLDTSKKAIIKKDEMKKILGRSPDFLDVLIMEMIYYVTPSYSGIQKIRY